MNYLLDTHTFLWFINDDKSLTAAARALIEAPENLIVLSFASLWEIAIKVSLGKLAVPMPFSEFIATQLDKNKIALSGFSVEHFDELATLPFHHRDPFDRMIIAYALFEKVAVIGKDEVFDTYGVKRLW